jgi:hypothetical protein
MVELEGDEDEVVNLSFVFNLLFLILILMYYVVVDIEKFIFY